jgi:gas vesicle protein
MRMSSIIVTTLFIGTAGIIAGTLFVPGKGSKTRNKMARKGKLYKDYLLDNFYDFADSVSHPFETLENETIRLSKKAKAKTKEIKTEVNQKLNG